MANYYELVEWETVRKDCLYPETDNNDGYIYGIHYLDDECQIVDVEWFTSEGKRIFAIAELLEMGYTRIK